MKKFIFLLILLLVAAATTFVYHKIQGADIDYYSAHQHFKQGNYDTAIQLYKKVLAEKESHIEALEELGLSYFWTGRYAEAIETFRKFLSYKPADNDIKKALAEALHYSGKTKEAAVLYEEILGDKTKQPDEAREENVKKLLGEAYMIGKDYEDSVRQYRAVLKKNPQDIKTRIALADILSWQKKYDEAVSEYLEALKAEPDNIQIKEKLANVYMWKKDYESAERLFIEIIKYNPENSGSRAALGELLMWEGRFPEAIICLQDALAKDKENLKAKALLAEVLSWVKRYKESLKLYDEILDKKEDAQIKLQKARVLGWAKYYDKSLKEYRRILDNKYDAAIELEMNSKAAYWDNRVKTAIKNYNNLIEKDPKNIEAMFDLSQIYAHNQMWEKAIAEFKNILLVSSEHFRAEKGLEKAKLVSGHVSLKSGYEFNEADSQSRDTDIRKHTMTNKLSFPIGYNLNMGVEDRLATRMFSDFKDVLENEARVSLSYLQNPYGWAEGFYNIITYDSHIDSIQTFGAKVNVRVLDCGTNTFFYERNRLENSSRVIIDNLYSDNFKERIDIDINSRLRAGADYLYQSYSDDNKNSEPGFDILYYLSMDPMRLSAKYRYFFRDFKDKSAEYFSPQDFTAHTAEFNWRHYLNKQETFYGANDIYYEIGYAVSRDSFHITAHKFTGGINWDINKKLNLNLQGSVSRSSKKVYRDSGVTASFKYYF